MAPRAIILREKGKGDSASTVNSPWCESAFLNWKGIPRHGLVFTIYRLAASFGLPRRFLDLGFGLSQSAIAYRYKEYRSVHVRYIFLFKCIYQFDMNENKLND